MYIKMIHVRYFIFGAFAGIFLVFGSLFVQAQDEPQILTISKESTGDHEKFHYPIIDDILLSDVQDKDAKLIAKPYLTLPFRKSDLEKQRKEGEQLYEITEGWTYSDHELSIHGVDPLHGGVDVYVDYGTPVISPVDGFVISSYQVAPLYNEYGERKTYKGQTISMGLGYFVYIYVPSVKRWVEIGHLADIDPSIPFFTPEKQEDGSWNPPTRGIQLAEYLTNPKVKYIQKGHPIGTVGHSGLMWGDYEEYKEGAERPIVIDPTKHKSWDEPHIHFEEFWIHQGTGEKGWQRDPYGIYKTGEHYPTYKRPLPLGKDPLWIVDDFNYPKFSSN